MRQRRITFYGNFGTQNFGNEWTLHAIVRNLLERMPDARFQCLCTTPEDTRQRHGMPAFRSHAQYPAWLDAEKWGRGRFLVKVVRKLLFRIPVEIWHWAKGVRIMSRSDMLIVPGTQVVSDYNTGPWSWPYDIFMWCLLAKLCRAKVLFVGVGIGPIYHPVSRWFITSALRMADYRSYRDNFSKSYLESLGFSPNGDRVYPDLVFSLPERELLEWKPREEHGGVVGVAVKDYAATGSEEYEDYLERMGRLVAWLCGCGHTVRVLIGDVLYDTSVWEDFVERLKQKRIGTEGGRIVTERISTAEDLLKQLCDCDVVISPRLHNLILSVMLSRPVIAFSDHQKLDSLMLELGLAEWCVPLHNLAVEVVQKKFLELEANLDGFKARVAKSAAECREALQGQYKEIENLLN